MEASNESVSPGGKTPNRQGLYAQVAVHIPRAIDKLVALLNSRNEAIAMGAAKAIMDKGLPDLRAMELGGQNGEPIKLYIDIGHGFIPSGVLPDASPTGSPEGGQPPVQGAGMAPESPKDDNSVNGAGQAGPS